MSKKVKALVERDIKNRLGDIDGVAVISPRGLNGLKNNALRGKLHASGLRMIVVKNTLAKRATAGSKIVGFDKLMDGPSALIFGKGVAVPTIARLLMEAKKDNDALDLKGVFFDGDVYVGEAGVKTASKLPTREEAISSLLGSILAPGRNLGKIFNDQAAKVASLVKAVEAKHEAAGAPAAA